MDYKHLKIRIDSGMLKNLQAAAELNRRDTHAHVLWLIDNELSNYVVGEAGEIISHASMTPTRALRPSKAKFKSPSISTDGIVTED